MCHWLVILNVFSGLFKKNTLIIFYPFFNFHLRLIFYLIRIEFVKYRASNSNCVETKYKTDYIG